MHTHGHFQALIAIFYTVFLVNQQLSGLALAKHLLNDLFVFLFSDGFSKLLKLAIQEARRCPAEKSGEVEGSFPHLHSSDVAEATPRTPCFLLLF